MKALLNIRDVWDIALPVSTYVDVERDKLAAAVISNTIHEDLKNVTDDADTAVDAMRALQKHFQRGGRTNQFSLFARLMTLRLDLSESEMLTHMSAIDLIVAELDSTGFTWTSESIRGLLYQLHMPADMTKEINKDLDHKFDDSSPKFKLEDIKSAIQIHLACEKTTTATISINSLSTNIEALLLGRHPSQRRGFPSSSSFSASPRTSQLHRAHLKIDPMRWKRGPAAWTGNNHERQATAASPLSIPNTAVKGVRDGQIQCFFCGHFGHTYNAHDSPCQTYNANHDRTAADWRDWRKLTNNQYYSLNTLYPSKYSLPINQQKAPTVAIRPSVKSVDVSIPHPTAPVEISAIYWMSEGFDAHNEMDKVPTEYLFNGGATDSVGHDCSILLEYRSLPQPIPIKTAANDSKAVIVLRMRPCWTQEYVISIDT